MGGYVAGYDAPYLHNRMTINEVVGNLKNRFHADGVFFGHRDALFVAHSLAGLVVERLLLTHREPAGKAALVHFFSTPDTGAQTAELGHAFSAVRLLKEMLPSDVNDYLQNKEREWLSRKFTMHRYCA